MAPRTLYQKIFDDHLIREEEDGTCLIYIDRHLVHEVTSPQAFEGLRMAKRPVRRTDCTLATVDHNIPTSSRKKYVDTPSFIEEPSSRTQVVTLEQNVKEFGLTFFGMTDDRQGIVHVIGPEQGFTLPGATIVCGDSHTSTHGAFGALAFGIGTSEVEHVLATQTIIQKRAKNMRVQVDGDLLPGVSSKDIVLYVIGLIGTAGGTGSVIEFCGTAIEKLSMEARMSICNMSIEAGARAGLIAPDEVTFEYLKGRPLAPKGAEWEKALAYWKSLPSDPDAKYDVVIKLAAKDIPPTVTWGTSPQDAVSVTGTVPDPANAKDAAQAAAWERSLTYMGLEANTPVEQIKIDKVFLGSCTNSRIEDLRSAAKILQGRKVAEGVYAMLVPGSGLVKKQAEAEGLDKVFKAAGFDWREAGCSMCLGMNPDQLAPGERCASTSNRNFEGRQGPGGRTHLVSPAMAAAAAVTGHLTDVRTLLSESPKAPAAQPEVEIIDSKTFLPPPETPPAPLNGQADADSKPAEKTTDEDRLQDAPPSEEATAGSGLQAFTTITGIAAPIERPNVDTDLIIPARFLKVITRSGLGGALLYTLRYIKDTGAPNPDFALNKEPWSNAKFIVAGPNWGCGSSREHAAWSLLDFGIRAVIAPSIADIHATNLSKNGLVGVVLPQEQVDRVMEDAKAGKPVTVDLQNQVVVLQDGSKFSFPISEFTKHCLLNGLDDISLTLQHAQEIASFEAKRSVDKPWYDGFGYKGPGPKAIPVGDTKKLKANDW